ncbi:MAG: hypothetical protein HN742_19620 [Lentisphaerae bacterium]|jgi:hypothetical protein|nr:hypothetical protein [Lentisphaerota bacterium]MBT4815848.1 hypothetical protein [Lentisphaerota bacterium]MBT5608007.1 hypothetical protein [Lentisphaerota bacterium]MBT7060669.1 hypothetical protein [Lentisphaerota bacterium]MBT7844099.1 hypothetical protein [Lentisphaerota bacterium]
MATFRDPTTTCFVIFMLSGTCLAVETHNTLTPVRIPTVARPKGLPTFTHRSGRSPAFRLYERKLRTPGATIRLDYRKGLPEFHQRGTPVPAFHPYEGKRIPSTVPRMLPAPPRRSDKRAPRRFTR